MIFRLPGTPVADLSRMKEAYPKVDCSQRAQYPPDITDSELLLITGKKQNINLCMITGGLPAYGPDLHEWLPVPRPFRLYQKLS